MKAAAGQAQTAKLCGKGASDTMKNILVIGSLNMDLSIRSDRMPKLGETLAGYGFAAAPGGKGANQAAAAGKLGAPVRMLGGVGNDGNGRALLDALRGCGVDCSAVFTTDRPTGVAMIVVVNGNNFILIEHGANFALAPEDFRSGRYDELFAWADTVLMQLEIPLPAVAAAAERAKAHGDLVFLNPAPMDPALDGEILRNVDLLIPNEHEAADLAGFPVSDRAQAEKAAALLYGKYGCKVLLTLGENGSLLYDGESFFHQPAFRVHAVDTTAAGDSYLGGLCAAMASGAQLREAMGYASAVAACAVQKPGALPSLPDADQVQQLIEDFRA